MEELDPRDAAADLPEPVGGVGRYELEPEPERPARFSQEAQDRAADAALARARSMVDPAVPPAYRGRTWEMEYRGQIVQSIFPPMREYPGGPLSDAFLDFRKHHGERVAALHPEYYCVRCGLWLIARVGDVCGHCLIRERREAAARGTLGDAEPPVAPARPTPAVPERPDGSGRRKRAPVQGGPTLL